MKITEYSSVTKLDDKHVLLVDGSETGTRTILATDAIYAMLHLGAVENHRLIFRGKKLGETVTEGQIASIKAGTFEDMWLGDYWEIGGVKYRIADFDYWMNAGNPVATSHHVLLVPDTNMYTGPMNDTAVTTGGYKGSKMYTTGLVQAKNAIQTAFSGKLFTHKEFLTTTVSDGVPTAGEWTDSTVELMNEIMVYGGYIDTPSGATSKRYTIDKTQLALFSLAPKYANIGGAYWLRDTTSASMFACVDQYGAATSIAANVQNGVRPVFAIG